MMASEHSAPSSTTTDDDSRDVGRLMSIWLSIAHESPRRRESPQSPSLRLRIQPRRTRPLRYRVHRGWILCLRFGLWRLSPLLFGDIGVRPGLRKLRPRLLLIYRLRAPNALRALRCPCRSLAPLLSGFRQASRLIKGELVRCPVRCPSVPSAAPAARKLHRRQTSGKPPV